MFGLFSNAFLKSEIKDLERELQYKKEEVIRLRQIIDNQKKEVCNEPVSFDFKAVKVFSVERMWNDCGAYTLIGYVLNDETQEWNLYCSSEQHERLVKEFQESRKV